MSLAVTDAPVDSALKVCVEFASAEFNHSDGSIANPTFDFDPPRQIDLLTLQGSDSAALLLGEEMAAGNYNWIRLGVNAPRGAPTLSDDSGAGEPCVAGGSYIKLDSGVVHNLFIPSGSQSGLQLNRGFTLPAGGNASFTVDFDLRKSITAPPGQSPDYMMRPTLRLVDNAAAGSLVGGVLPQLVTDSCTTGEPVVYVFSGSVTPDDYDGDEGDALTSAMVTSDDNGVSYSYEVGFLAAGDYTAAFTCDADDVEADEVITFLPADGVQFSLAADEVKVQDFPPAP
ncbi:MAG: DUF4382 domain-containing protein [Gammaproteobacteria bacterium]|nr:DUF4382 domain-containing protein [Gammaproteobacteria bacterium]